MGCLANDSYADSTLIGDLGFIDKPDQTGIGEIGYEVLSAYHQKGFAIEAAEALIYFAFTLRELKRIIAQSSDNHGASIRILKKLGMEQIGRDENLLKWELKLESRQF
ncbi:MAG: GNAT family N-acetyltransferase [Nostoc sp.]|uniref:GNAT family N-acetyltransferase n=1 Tax=Nostoc sp. TaxID=1180 RepID=UPI002FF87A95